MMLKHIGLRSNFTHQTVQSVNLSIFSHQRKSLSLSSAQKGRCGTLVGLDDCVGERGRLRPTPLLRNDAMTTWELCVTE
jgi:hypothetical protein